VYLFFICLDKRQASCYKLHMSNTATYSKKFGNRLKAVRARRNFTQKIFAEAAGVSLRTLNYYESGKFEPQASTINRFAELLDVTPDYLLNGDSDE
jgi:transcriptional regulator with XRE-family HTH domain